MRCETAEGPINWRVESCGTIRVQVMSFATKLKVVRKLWIRLACRGQVS